MFGPNGAAPGRAQSTGAELGPNHGNSAGGRKLDVGRNDAVWSWLSSRVASQPVKGSAIPASG